MGIFSRKVEQTDQERADALAANGLGLFTQARDSLIEANLLNDKIVLDAIQRQKDAKDAREATIAAAERIFEAETEAATAQSVSAVAARNQNNRALDALNGIIGS